MEIDNEVELATMILLLLLLPHVCVKLHLPPSSILPLPHNEIHSAHPAFLCPTQAYPPNFNLFPYVNKAQASRASAVQEKSAAGPRLVGVH